MAKVPGEIGIVPSLLDRLLDNAPEVSKEPPEARLQNLREPSRVRIPYL